MIIANQYSSVNTFSVHLDFICSDLINIMIKQLI